MSKNLVILDTWNKGYLFVNSLLPSLRSRFETIYLLTCESYFPSGVEVNDESLVLLDLFTDSAVVRSLSEEDITVLTISLNGVVQRTSMELFRNSRKVFFMHGLKLDVNATYRKKGLLVKISRGIYYAKFFLRFYFRYAALIRLSHFAYFAFEILFHNSRSNISPRSTIGTQINTVMLNHRSEESMVKRFLHSYDRLLIVGNLRIYSEIQDVKRSKVTICNNVLFIDQPGLIAEDELVELLNNIKNSLGEARKLMIRFHPSRRDAPRLSERLENTGISISTKNAKEDYSWADAAVGFNSAMLWGFSLLGKLSITLRHELNYSLMDVYPNEFIRELDIEDIMLIGKLLTVPLSEEGNEVFLLDTKELILNEIR